MSRAAGVQRWFPSLEGVLPFEAEHAFRIAYETLYGLLDRAEGVDRAGFATHKDVAAATDPRRIRDLMSAISPQTALNVDNLLGVLAQPQKASAPAVTTLPDVSDPLSQDGQLVWKSNESVLYRFDATTEPGTWVPILGVIQKPVTLTADRVEAVPTDVPDNLEVEFQYTQDAVGGWKVTFNAAFKGVDVLTVGRTATRLSIVRFRRFTSTKIVRLFSLSDILVT